jgi:hypothetical protein
MEIDALTHPTDARAAERALAEAVAAAGFAPSVDDTQPWRWRLTGSTLDLHLERDRIAPATDPDGRRAILSCGVALHHARVALATQGWHVTVTRMLLGADRDLLARLHVDGRSPVDPASALLLRAIPMRRGDRRAVTGEAVDPADLTAITMAAQAYGARLQRLRPDQVLEFAAVTDRAPDQAVFLLLHGSSDEPLHWLNAGEALSAAWLTATGLGVSVRPLTSAGAGPVMRAMIADAGRPYLVLRMDRIDPDGPGPAEEPRASAAQIVERF